MDLSTNHTVKCEAISRTWDVTNFSTREKSRTTCGNSRAKLDSVGHVICLIGIVSPINNILHNVFDT